MAVTPRLADPALADPERAAWLRSNPEWTEAELEQMRKAALRRVRKIRTLAKPCPKCGAMPEVDLGFLDAPYAEGQERISCPVYLIGIPGIPDQACDTHSTGVAAWNWRAAPEGGR